MRLEEYEDEKTRITFDPDKGELVVQLPADAMEDASVRVYLVAEEDGSREELVLERHGRVLQGVSRQVPKGEFQVNIEAGEE